MAGAEPAGPPMFDALTGRALREGRSLKWTRYGPAIGAFVADMDFGTAPAVTRSLHETVGRGQLGYLTPEAAADMARACAGWQAAIERFTPPGSPVVLPTPAYMPFLAVPGALDRDLIRVPMVERDGPAHRHGDVDVEGLERAGAHDRAADPVQRRGRAALGAGGLSVRPRRIHPGRAGRDGGLRRRR